MFQSIKKNILIDKEKNNFLNERGYIVLELITEKELKIFDELYNKWHKKSENQFYRSYFSPDKNYKREVEDSVLEIFLPKLKLYFQDFQSVGGMFVIKPPGEDGHFPPHQDWSFVDEENHWSVNMWCPLKDVEEDDGCIYVLEGSHNFNVTIRGANTPDTYDHLYEEILKNVKMVPMKKGQVIFFFHGLVHGSTLNKKSKDRVSVGLSLIEKEAPVLYHFYNTDSKTTERYNVKDLSFYIDYVTNRDKKPNTINSEGIIDFCYKRLSKEELFDKIINSQPLKIE